jgi:hypothetical protein
MRYRSEWKLKAVAVVGIVAGLAAISGAELIYGMTARNVLVTFDSNAPANLLSGVAVSGLASNENLLGIDFRTSNGLLYAVGSSNRLYTINTSTGAATAVGGPFAPSLDGTAFGIGFNQVSDRLRSISNTRQNLRIDPSTGGVASVDPTPAYVSGDPNFGIPAVLTGVDYTVPASNATIGYAVDSNRDTLVLLNNPNLGQISTVGSLGVNITALAGMQETASGSTL